MSNKVIVDRTLFITCRLCLEDLGEYQIVPEVKDQISFCFNINVEPFDGLPQLICTKCEQILSNYSEIKKKFIAKQYELKCKISVQCAVPQTSKEAVTVPQDDIKDHTLLSPVLNVPPTTSKPENAPWENDYKKMFFCKFCDTSYSNKIYLTAHLFKHKSIKMKHSSILKKHWQVVMRKCDGKPNLTGTNNIVVYDQTKMVENCFTDHYVVYFNIGCASELHSRSYNFKNLENQYDSSDSNSIVSNSRRKLKRRRISSNSSNETVVLDENRNGVAKLQQLSYDETERDSNNVADKNITVSKDTNKDSTVSRIIDLCTSKYIKSQIQEIKNIPDTVGFQIRRKILSFGRRNINSKYINSTALLRFLQYKNLEISWLAKSVIQNNSDSNLVKIMTKLKHPSLENKNDAGWVDHSPAKKGIKFNYELYCNGCGNDEPENSKPNIADVCALPNEISVTDMSDSAVLCSLYSSKLLNENPVPNPKQLPKKSPTHDKIIAKGPLEMETEICMPIITSTTSLAEPEKENTVSPAPVAPRIKVKPVSELMSKESISRLLDPPKLQAILPQERMVSENPTSSVPNIYIISPMPMTTPSTTMTMTNSISNCIMSAINNVSQSPMPNDFVILDTVELPNTRTDSPFNYLRNLLQIHNIILLDTDADLSPDFHCLIKFKVLYKQESKDQPVILCLSLHCNKNVFCLKVRDRNQDDINITKISANWQWEILKIYKGEVVNKLLNNATKIGREIFEYTNNFLCLLKSVKYVSFP